MQSRVPRWRRTRMGAGKRRGVRERRRINESAANLFPRLRGPHSLGEAVEIVDRFATDTGTSRVEALFDDLVGALLDYRFEAFAQPRLDLAEALLINLFERLAPTGL